MYDSFNYTGYGILITRPTTQLCGKIVVHDTEIMRTRSQRQQ